KVLETDAASPDFAHARVVVPPSERVIQDIAAASDGLYVTDLDGGLGRLRRLDYTTREVSEVTLPMSGSIQGPASNASTPGVLFGMQGWISPPVWYRFDGSGSTRLAIAPPWAEDSSALGTQEGKGPGP